MRPLCGNSAVVQARGNGFLFTLTHPTHRPGAPRIRAALFEKTKADARFHPPVAAFRYQFVRFGRRYALFFEGEAFFRQEWAYGAQK